MSNDLSDPKAPKVEVTATSSFEPEELDRLLSEIGLARFAGRVHAGLLPSEAAYEAIERHAATERGRPLTSQLLHALLGRDEPFVLR
jgi:hypothetical protein